MQGGCASPIASWQIVFEEMEEVHWPNLDEEPAGINRVLLGLSLSRKEDFAVYFSRYRSNQRLLKISCSI